MALPCISGCRECTGCGDCSEEPEVVFTCTDCGAEIYEGDDYYEVFEEPYCEDCVKYKTA